MYAQSTTGSRISHMQFGAALLLRAAMDAYAGFQTRDADFLASARSGAAIALELLFPDSGLAPARGKQSRPLGYAC
jgi:hypothetical protein